MQWVVSKKTLKLLNGLVKKKTTNAKVKECNFNYWNDVAMYPILLSLVDALHQFDALTPSKSSSSSTTKNDDDDDDDNKRVLTSSLAQWSDTERAALAARLNELLSVAMPLVRIWFVMLLLDDLMICVCLFVVVAIATSTHWCCSFGKFNSIHWFCNE